MMTSKEIKKMAKERMMRAVDIVVQEVYKTIEEEAKLGHMSTKIRMGDVDKKTQRYFFKCLKKDGYKIKYIFSDVYEIRW